jgi:hypothetical protein
MRKRSSPRRRRGGRVFARSLGYTLFALGLFNAAGAIAADGPATTPPGAAMRMYRDPDTGRIGAPSPEIVSDRNGVKVNLRGRFRAAVRRSADSGTVQHECTEGEAAVHE